MTATRFDDFWNALVAKAVALQATTLAEVSVQDGSWPAAYVVTDPDFLIIGGDFEPTTLGQTPVTTTPTPSRMGNNSYDEAIALRCVAVSQSGDTTMAPRRARATAIVEAFQDGLTADPDLGGLLEEAARVAVDAVRPIQTAKGAYCAINFTVSASALIWNG